jgi:CrcB protein
MSVTADLVGWMEGAPRSTAGAQKENASRRAGAPDPYTNPGPFAQAAPCANQLPSRPRDDMGVIVKPTAIALVALGGALGSVARYLVGLGITTRWGSGWPYGTFVINITGSFAIGFFLTLTTERVVIDEGWRFLFPIGFVGAYTTFSTFEYETLRLIEGGAWGRAASYVLGSTVAGFAAVWLAAALARRP